jgi:OOP family OmpA-OmpF porin
VVHVRRRCDHRLDEHGTNYHLKQTGIMVTGCFDGSDKPIDGGLEGRLLRFTWNTDTDTGPAIAVFDSTGHLFIGRWQANSAVTEHPVMSTVIAKKKTVDPGSCPAWSGKQDALADELTNAGCMRLYGINFDSDAETIRAESKPTLDRLATMLKVHADLKITIEGHTDSTSTAAHN